MWNAEEKKYFKKKKSAVLSINSIVVRYINGATKRCAKDQPAKAGDPDADSTSCFGVQVILGDSLRIDYPRI